MDVDIPPHSVHVAEPVLAGLAPGKPKQAGQHPVAAWKPLVQLARPHLPGRPASHEHRVLRLPFPEFRAPDVPAARGLEAAVFLAQAFFRRGNGIAFEDALAVEQRELLLPGVDDDALHRRAAKKPLSNALHSAASSPPSSFTEFLSTSFFGS